MTEISLILDLAFVAYLEHLYFSTSVALISAVAIFIKGSDNFFISCDYKNEKCEFNKRNKPKKKINENLLLKFFFQIKCDGSN